MIVDIRTRVWTGRDPFLGESGSGVGRLRVSPEASPEAHRRAMSVVDVSAVVGWRADRMGIHIPAEQVAGIVNQDPSRLVGFAGIDPTAESALDEVDRAADLGLIGVAMCPADCGCRPTDDRFLAALERAAARRMPALIANPCMSRESSPGRVGSVLEFARPSLLDEAARTIPGLTIVLGDVGHSWSDEALLLAARHERAFIEISGVVGRPWSLYTLLLSAYERAITTKLLFASDFPAETPERAIERLYTLSAFRGASAMPAAPSLPREVIRAIVERDALAVLGVDAPLVDGRSRPAARQPAATTAQPARV